MIAMTLKECVRTIDSVGEVLAAVILDDAVNSLNSFGKQVLHGSIPCNAGRKGCNNATVSEGMRVVCLGVCVKIAMFFGRNGVDRLDLCDKNRTLERAHAPDDVRNTGNGGNVEAHGGPVGPHGGTLDDADRVVGAVVVGRKGLLLVPSRNKGVILGGVLVEEV